MRKRKRKELSFWQRLARWVIFIIIYLGTFGLTVILLDFMQMDFWISIVPWFLMALIIGLKWGRHIFIVFGIESDGHGKEGLMAGFVVSNMIMWIYLGAVYLFQQLL